MMLFSSADVRKLLHNKYVAVLGDSIQRSVYKDLVKILQDDEFLTENQLKRKGEMSFANDTLVEGGSLGEMHNGITYREVRQYRTDHHLVRFYFLTRVYSDYIESVLADFEQGPQPDVVIINSCIWDVIRYHDQSLEMYKTNLDHLFIRLTEVLSPECLVIWNMAMPVGFKAGEVLEYPIPNVRWDIIKGNFYSATLADLHKLDVIDMHFFFRFELHSRAKDATHWNQLAHRQYTCILMAHIAQAWGVQPSDQRQVRGLSIPRAPPVAPPRSVVYSLPVEKKGPRCLGPRFLPGYTPFDGIDPSHTIETFNPGNVGYPSNQMNSNAASPFADDSPFLVGNFTLRNFGLGGYGKIADVNLTVPMFENHPFNGMTIPPHHMAVPDWEFCTFQYNSTMPQETWTRNQRFPKRKRMKPEQGWAPPYYPPRQSYQTRI
ncbi:PC-esterase domain-containing protein 1A-like isoform X2 [Pyxicephalus adspersus]|uniref:PC-esterase domain-containing protein 1A-like isoform X2 n=1 Tax=Pyxicephalus adspersus TaxID=30357 RepID=UPI003B598866